METKELNCVDEELHIEIVKPGEETQDLIITVSLTRSYMIADPLKFINENGDGMQISRDKNLTHSFSM